MRIKERNPFIAPSFMLGGDSAATGQPSEGEPDPYRRGAIHHHGLFDWRWSIDTRGRGRNGPTSWFTEQRGVCLTFGGALRELRRYWARSA